jgi:hypothetical protein
MTAVSAPSSPARPTALPSPVCAGRRSRRQAVAVDIIERFVTRLVAARFRRARVTGLRVGPARVE